MRVHAPVLNLYQRWIDELWSGPRDLDALTATARELLTDDFVSHCSVGVLEGPDALAAHIFDIKSRYCEVTYDVVVPGFTDGRFVAGRWAGVAASEGGAERLAGNDILAVRDGKFCEHWAANA